MKRGLVLIALVLLAAGPASAQTRIVTGRVVDSLSQETVTSGQVLVNGTTITGTIRDDGTFTLALPVRDVTLSIRSIGFKRREVAVPSGQNSVSVDLARDYFQLEAIVVTGQATGVERRNLANAVATVTAEQLTSVSSVSLDQALQGKLAGASIVQASGAPGGSGVVSLRGVTSISGAFTPLYVIDGVIASDVALPRGSNFVSQSARGSTIATQGENAVNRIADLNPNDIENIEVLKGAAAAAIYGSKASNGVILITTKRGRVGAPQFGLVQRVGVSAVSKLMGTRRFQTLQDAVAVYGARAQDPVTGWAADRFFDNEKVLAGQKPIHYETALSLSGGTETTRYYSSVLVRHEGGIVGNTYADKRSLRLNVEQAVGSRINLQLGADVTNSAGDKSLTFNENNNSSLWASLANTPSFYDMRRPCDRHPGDAGYAASCDGPGGVWSNPYVASNALQTAALLKNQEDVWRFIGTSRLTLDVLAGPQHSLRLIASGGADFFNQENRVFSPPELLFEPVDGLLGTASVSNANNLNFNVNANGVYTLKAPSFSATTQFGMQYESRQLRIARVLAANLIGGLDAITAGTTVGVDGSRQAVKDFGLFAQEEFLTMGEKLMLTLGIRADQSSNNGDPDRLFYYPKAAASYRMPGLVPGFVDELKLRAAYGQSGNQPLYGQKFTELQGVNIVGAPASLMRNQAAAENIVPERQREIEGGIDATLFRGRANLEATAYEKRITDLLLARGLPESFGFSQEFINGGVLRTRGLELVVTGLPVQSRSMTWSPRVTYSMWRSKIVELPVPRFGGGGFPGASVRIEEGKSTTQVIGDDSLPDGSRTLSYMGETRPDYTLQLSNEARYKAFRFSFLLDRQKGGTAVARTFTKYDQVRNTRDYDDPAPVPGRKLGEWRLTTSLKQAAIYIQDASFLKLREATVGVDLPLSTVRKVWSNVRHARLSLSGRNLLTFTKFDGLDPEQRQRPDLGWTSVPSELWAYPPSRAFWLSLDVGF